MADPKVLVRKVGGPQAVIVPGHKGQVQVGDEVELPRGQALALVDGGEFERVPKTAPAKKDEPAAPAKKE